jgi:hypothetical protein
VRISLPFFLGSYFVALTAHTALLIALSRSWLPVELTGVVLIPAICLVVLLYVLLYKAWSAIQDGRARATPARAVGFLFIPFFNLYWTFEAVWGFAKNYNRLVRRHGLDLELLPEWPFLIFSILTLSHFFPWFPWWGGSSACW